MVHVKKGRQETKEGKEIQRGRTDKKKVSVKTQTTDIQQHKQKIIR